MAEKVNVNYANWRKINKYKRAMIIIWSAPNIIASPTGSLSLHQDTYYNYSLYWTAEAH